MRERFTGWIRELGKPWKKEATGTERAVRLRLEKLMEKLREEERDFGVSTIILKEGEAP